MNVYILPQKSFNASLSEGVRRAAYNPKNKDWFLHPDMIGVRKQDVLALSWGGEESCIFTKDKSDVCSPLVSVKAATAAAMIPEACAKILPRFIGFLNSELVER